MRSSSMIPEIPEKTFAACFRRPKSAADSVAMAKRSSSTVNRGPTLSLLLWSAWMCIG